MNGNKELKFIKKFWTTVLKDKKITDVFFDEYGLAGFLLNDGTKVGYDFRNKGLYIDADRDTGNPTKYH